jgi:hypothetical protein
MGSIAHSHMMTGDASPSLQLRGVLLNEANTRMLELPHLKIRGVRRRSKKIP